MSNYTYMVTNNINGKVYVGSHCWDGEGIDPNYYGSGTAITRAVRKYGKENFQVEVLYYYDTVEECRQDEERILTEYDVKNCPHSYNCKNAAVGMTSEDVTEKQKDALSQARNYQKTPVVAINKNGNVKIFESQRECSRVLGIDHRGVNDCLKGRCKTHKGYTFKYIEQLESGIYEGITDLTLEPSKITPTPIVAIQKDTGRVRMFESQHECSRVLGIHQGSVNKCLKGKRKSTGGYTFKKINRDRRVFTVSQRSKADLNVLRGIAE